MNFILEVGGIVADADAVEAFWSGREIQLLNQRIRSVRFIDIKN